MPHIVYKNCTEKSFYSAIVLMKNIFVKNEVVAIILQETEATYDPATDDV